LSKAARRGLAFGRNANRAGIRPLNFVPGFEETSCQISACLHEECSRSARHIANPQVKEVPRRSKLPLFLCQTGGGADIYGRFECVLHDRFGETAGRVVGSGATAFGSSSHVHTASSDDDRISDG